MKDKMKVYEIIPTLGGGGAEKMVLDLSHGLSERGCEVTVVSLYDSQYAAEHRIKFAQDNNIKIEYLHKKRGFDFRLLLRLKKMISKENPDIVHTHIEAFQYIAILGLFMKFMHVHTMHSTVGRETGVYKYLLSSSSRRKRTRFVALSESIGQAMRTSFGTTDDSLFCIPNGIDRNVFCYKERPFSPEKTKFISVGSLIPVKNQKMLIDAFFRVEQLRNNVDTLVILGEGQLRKEIETTIKEYGLTEQVSLPGNVLNVRDYLYGADVFVMTSHYEGVSLALLEAASTGLPVVVTRTGNTPDVVENDAVLVEDNDCDMLAEKLLLMAEDKDFRKKYANRSRCLSERFDKEKMVDSYLDIYIKAIEEE